VYANVVVDRPLERRPPPGADPQRGRSGPESLTYRLPEGLREEAAVGHLVRVPLGGSTALGVIVELADEPPPDLSPGVEVRDVANILDPLPVVTAAQIALARWLAAQTLAPLHRALRLMLPPGLEERIFVTVCRSAGGRPPEELGAEGEEVLRLLQRRRGRVRLSTLLNQVRAEDPEGLLAALADRGLIDVQPGLVPPQPAPPRVQYVRVLADEDSLEAALPRLGHPSKQADALLVVARRADSPLTLSQVCRLAECSAAPIQALAEKGWVQLTPRRTLLSARAGAQTRDVGVAAAQAQALEALLARGGTAELGSFLRETGIRSSTVAALEKKGVVCRVEEEPLVLPSLPPGEVTDRVVALRGSEKERAVLEALRGRPGRVWVGGIYAETGADLATLRSLAERGLISLHAEEYDRPPPESGRPARLTAEQQAAWTAIAGELGRQRPGDEPFVALLHGVTGSGKTELYLRALEATLAAGRRAIALVPEISLTPQTVQRFEARFPGRVAVLHSKLSQGQRYAAWNRVRCGEADVVIGPRSALFAPVKRLGLVVLDEMHDASYKQDDPIPAPSYDARDAAVALGRITGAAVVLGSATPDVVSYFRATGGPGAGQARPPYRLLELTQRVLPADGHEPAGLAPLPPVRLVDLRQELRAGNRGIFSRALEEALRHTLEAGEQAILFLNRRGSATFVLCRDCGAVARCPACDLPLTYHGQPAEEEPEARRGRQAEALICHHCNRRQPPPRACPACGGRRIRYFGLGTEKVEEAVRQAWPAARLLRWDSDTASGLDHARFLETFAAGRADVLIGTQMIAKGLDLPRVTLVGVVSADTALNLPDYRAAEQTFQLLTQVAGRAGRSHRGGQVIVQTYNPEHYAIRAAAQHDYQGFYRQEIAHRRRLGYPPFSRLVALRTSHSDAHRCRVEAERLGAWLAAEIRRLGTAAALIGPAPCFYSRLAGRSRWQIVIRARDPMPLLRDLALPLGWQVDVDPISLL
jgi:primosomal protein N' (replication factor Y)